MEDNELTKFQQSYVVADIWEIFMHKNFAHSDLLPEKRLDDIKDKGWGQNLLVSVVFLLLWRPSMMEKEEAGNKISLSSLSWRQWAADSANLFPI